MSVLFLLLALPVVANCAKTSAVAIDEAANYYYEDEASRNFRKSLPALADALDEHVSRLECNYDDVVAFVNRALLLRYELPKESLMHKYFVNMVLFALGRDDNVKQRTVSLRMQFILGTFVSLFNHAKMSQVPWDKVAWGDWATSAEASKEWPQDGSTLSLSEDVFCRVLPAERALLEATFPRELFLSVAIGFERVLEAFIQQTPQPEVDTRLVLLWRQIPNVQPADFVAEDAVAGFVHFQTYIGQGKRGDKAADILRAALPLLQ